MSFTKTGKTLHTPLGQAGLTFGEAIAQAILSEFGASPVAMKRIAKLTSASERTVRNWLDGTTSPSCENLVVLMCHSDAVLEATLKLAGRAPSDVHERLANVRRQLLAILSETEWDPPV